MNLPFSKTRRVGSTLYLSGEIGFDAEGTVPAGIEAQTRNIFERLKARLNRRAGRALDASLSFGQAFCAGALARLVATLLCYPFFFARISAQAGGRGGMQSVMSKIWREQGLGGLYTGLSSELARGVIFHAVNMGCLEMLRAPTSRLLTRS